MRGIPPPPPPLSFIKRFHATKSVKHRKLLHEMFRHCETKKVNDKSWYSLPPFIHKIFPYLIVSEPQRGSSRIRCGTVRQNNFHWKSWLPRPSYPRNFSIPEIFWNTGVFLCKKFRHRETNKIDVKSWNPPFIHISFPY